MKKKNLGKLSLRKTTLSNLDIKVQRRIKGGETFLDCITNISLCTCGATCDLYSCFLPCATADQSNCGFCPTGDTGCTGCNSACPMHGCPTYEFICPLP